MFQLLNSLLKRATETDGNSIAGPDCPVQHGERRVGRVPMVIRQLWHVVQMTTNALHEAANAAALQKRQNAQLDSKAAEARANKALFNKVATLDTEAELATALLEAAIREEFSDEAGSGSVLTIRKDWVLVALPQQPPQSPSPAHITDLLRSIYGGLNGSPSMPSYLDGDEDVELDEFEEALDADGYGHRTGN